MRRIPDRPKDSAPSDAELRRAVGALRSSSEPSVRWKVRTGVDGEAPEAPSMLALRAEIARSARARALLGGARAERGPDLARQVYHKWRGDHWALAQLAELGFPPGDRRLRPLLERALELWLRSSFYRETDLGDRRPSATDRSTGVPLVRGRYRRCASQQGSALRYLEALAPEDRRRDALVERLLHWQWPDGGWNCDVRPEADTSSFFETLLPMRGLAAHAAATGSARARSAARRAAEVFLSRRLYRRTHGGEVIQPPFVQLHYPLYWHYDYLGGLLGMAEVGTLHDRRCEDALDRLMGRWLPAGGWPADARFYRSVGPEPGTCSEYVDWGGTSRVRPNEWVTADALTVLRAAGRLPRGV